jgi:hypothetical protein
MYVRFAPGRDVIATPSALPIAGSSVGERPLTATSARPAYRGRVAFGRKEDLALHEALDAIRAEPVERTRRLGREKGLVGAQDRQLEVRK